MRTLSALLLLLAAATPARAKDLELSLDDGKMTGRRSLAGSAHAVIFDRPDAGADLSLRAVRIHGSRYGGGYDPAATFFTVTVADPTGKTLAQTRARYDLFPAGTFAWVEIPLDHPVAVPPRFRIHADFDPTATKGVYVGIAVSRGAASSAARPGSEGALLDAGTGWMIRAVLTDEKPPPGDDVELALDDGEKIGERSLGGSGHAVEFRRPPGTFWIQSVRIYGQRYGGGYDPATATFRVSILGADSRLQHEETAPLDRFPAEGFVWTEVRLGAAVKCPSRFRVLCEFDPTETKGVYVGYSRGERPSSFVGQSGETPSRFTDGNWMIRVVLTKKIPSAPPPPPAPDRDAFLADFDFVAKTVGARYPAFEKKGIDWEACCREWRPRFADCPDEATHVRNLSRLFATLEDSHSGLTTTKTEVHVPAFDGLYGAGLWIAAGEGRLVLRALMPGHPLASKIRPGAELTRIGGRPAKVVHEEVRRRVREWIGWSSTHFLDARLSFQFFPFGDATELPVEFLNPDRTVERVLLARFGPGGRGLSRAAVSMPEGVSAEGRAVSAMLPGDVGYVRILGGMDTQTAGEFHRALEGLRGAKAILLDCRGMGGGGDGPAWEMAGRFFPKAAPLGERRLEPSGPFQLDGPVVMLTDEREISSAETFTWAMAETGRAVTVGRPTGGATIIPSMFDLPSGLASFRLGTHDRATPIRRVHPEGLGSPPDVFVPYAPPLFALGGDPEVAVGLRVLAEGSAGWQSALSGEGTLGEAGRSLRETAQALLEFETGRGTAADPLPDLAAAAGRIEKLCVALAGTAPPGTLKEARKQAEAFRSEVPAQRAFETLLTGPLPPPPEALASFLTTHGASRFATAAREAWPREK